MERSCRSNSSRSNSPIRLARLLAAAGAALALGSGCGVSVRVQTDLPPVRDATPERLGGPYYVIDASVQKTVVVEGATGSSTMMYSTDHGDFHAFCHERYPKLFSGGRTCVPILVRREAGLEEIEGLAAQQFGQLLLRGALFSTSTLTEHFEEAVSIGTRTGSWTDPVRFRSDISSVGLGLLSIPFRHFVCNPDQGWRDVDYNHQPNDRRDPMQVVCPERQAAIADALVHALESMTDEERESLADNGEAWARYYMQHPISSVEMENVRGRVVHNVSASGAGEQIAVGRRPRVISLDVDPSRRKGVLEAGLEGCNPAAAQDWLIFRALPDGIRAAYGGKNWNAFKIDSETVTPDGRYTLRFTIVE